ncbi:hypothetical protein CGCSCA4_v004337 [Colletotrichum siamense]|uniref:Uncharacterized protein n=1 Tax=Colletotrichum siamense TaxID=690259 RepID=A0A9P5EUS0_COLSI|nr:hypothetical protein CGCSCA4_v004337 [Colletotrichum siamense]KAF4859663.1 hypothetical protein CGCSCA2_v006171 [Colletotrichum siamense]
MELTARPQSAGERLGVE